MSSVSQPEPQVSLRDLLAQAAAMAVKQSREGEYVGAWAVADAILNSTPEAVEHRTRIMGIRDEAVRAAETFGLRANAK